MEIHRGGFEMRYIKIGDKEYKFESEDKCPIHMIDNVYTLYCPITGCLCCCRICPAEIKEEDI